MNLYACIPSVRVWQWSTQNAFEPFLFGYGAFPQFAFASTEWTYFIHFYSVFWLPNASRLNFNVIEKNDFIPFNRTQCREINQSEILDAMNFIVMRGLNWFGRINEFLHNFKLDWLPIVCRFVSLALNFIRPLDLLAFYFMFFKWVRGGWQIKIQTQKKLLLLLLFVRFGLGCVVFARIFGMRTIGFGCMAFKISEIEELPQE